MPSAGRIECADTAYRSPRNQTASDEVVSPRYVQAMCRERDPSTAKAGNPKTQGNRRHPVTLRKRRQAMDIEGKRKKEGEGRRKEGK